MLDFTNSLVLMIRIVKIDIEDREQVVCRTEEDSGMLMSSICIVLLVLAGRGGKGDRCLRGRVLRMGQLTLVQRQARMGIRNYIRRAAIPRKGSFSCVNDL